MFVAAERNIALRRPSRISSSKYGGTADKANDGNINGIFNRGSCTHNEDSLKPWWAVDLESERLVLSVHIYNRVDGTCVSTPRTDQYLIANNTILLLKPKQYLHICPTTELQFSKIIVILVHRSKPTSRSALGTEGHVADEQRVHSRCHGRHVWHARWTTTKRPADDTVREECSRAVPRHTK